MDLVAAFPDLPKNADCLLWLLLGLGWRWDGRESWRKGVRVSGLEAFLMNRMMLLSSRLLSRIRIFIRQLFYQASQRGREGQYTISSVPSVALWGPLTQSCFGRHIYNFMKKKAEEKKEIVPVFSPGDYWEYKLHPQEALDKLEAFLSIFAYELKALVLPERSLEENYAAVCEKAGCNVHPSLASKTKEVSHNDYGQKFAIFLNHKIDLATLKLFGFVIQHFKVNCLKLSNNNLAAVEAEEVRRILEKEEQLTTLYFEWNHLDDHPKRQDLFLACLRPSLQHLVLRECHLGDDLARELIKLAKEKPDGKLKSLDLYGNRLTPAIVEDIGNFLEESKTLEFLGLSKNAFSSEQCLARLFGAIGELVLSEEEYEQQRLKEKARDEVVEKNKKRKKGAAEEPVPFVFEVKETAGGRCLVKNTSLKILNLASNGLKDSMTEFVRKFVEGNGKGVELFLEGNKFSKAAREGFQFYDNVIY